MRIQSFNFHIDLLSVLLWQYDNSTNIKSLAAFKQDWFNTNHEEFWLSWYTNIFNLITADEFGLTVWVIILNLPLFLGPQPDPPGKPIWGFGPYHKNFDRGVFTSASGGNNPNLTIAEKRILLRLRFFQLISRGAIPEVNEFLDILFGTEGPTYLLDGLDMTITLIFDWQINRRLLDNILRYDLIPRDTGVKLKGKVNPRINFGFGKFHKNFDNGIFGQDF